MLLIGYPATGLLAALLILHALEWPESFSSRILRWRPLLYCGRISYGLYLFHNLAPLIAGKLLWFLWAEPFLHPAVDVLKVAAYAAITWALTLASWRWIETPLQSVRTRIR